MWFSKYQRTYNFFGRYWFEIKRAEENRGNVNKESLLQNRGIDVLAYRGAVCNWEIIAKSEVLAIFQNNYQAIIFERHESGSGSWIPMPKYWVTTPLTWSDRL